MQNLKKILKNKKGFTLVELMVVVAILGVLVAVAVPVYNNVTDNAKKNTCETNIRTIESAVAMYHAEVGGWPTDVAALTGTFGDNNEYGPYLLETPSCPFDSTKGYTITNGVVSCQGGTHTGS